MEQRQRERYRIWLPLRVRTDAGEIHAVTYDASDQGVLMLSAKPLALGARVTVTFEVPGDPPKQRTGTGRVVRAGPNHDDPHGLWPQRLAVALDATMEAFQIELEEAARRHPHPFAKG